MGELWQQPLKEKGERKPTLSPFIPLALPIKWKGNLIVMTEIVWRKDLLL